MGEAGEEEEEAEDLAGSRGMTLPRRTPARRTPRAKAGAPDSGPVWRAERPRGTLLGTGTTTTATTAMEIVLRAGMTTGTRAGGPAGVAVLAAVVVPAVQGEVVHPAHLRAPALLDTRVRVLGLLPGDNSQVRISSKAGFSRSTVSKRLGHVSTTITPNPVLLISHLEMVMRPRLVLSPRTWPAALIGSIKHYIHP